LFEACAERKSFNVEIRIPDGWSRQAPYPKKVEPDLRRLRERDRRAKLAATARRLVDLVEYDINLDWVDRIVLTRNWVIAICTDESECPIIEYREV
jgi:hypothetical protein